MQFCTFVEFAIYYAITTTPTSSSVNENQWRVLPDFINGLLVGRLRRVGDEYSERIGIPFGSKWTNKRRSQILVCSFVRDFLIALQKTAIVAMANDAPNSVGRGPGGSPAFKLESTMLMEAGLPLLRQVVMFSRTCCGLNETEDGQPDNCIPTAYSSRTPLPLNEHKNAPFSLFACGFLPSYYGKSTPANVGTFFESARLSDAEKAANKALKIKWKADHGK